MIETLFKQRSTLARLQSGPLAAHLPFIAEALRQEQYPPETVRRYVRAADGFSRWLCKQGLHIGSLHSQYRQAVPPAKGTRWQPLSTPILSVLPD